MRPLKSVLREEQTWKTYLSQPYKGLISSNLSFEELGDSTLTSQLLKARKHVESFRNRQKERQDHYSKVIQLVNSRQGPYTSRWFFSPELVFCVLAGSWTKPKSCVLPEESLHSFSWPKYWPKYWPKRGPATDVCALYQFKLLESSRQRCNTFLVHLKFGS